MNESIYPTLGELLDKTAKNYPDNLSLNYSGSCDNDYKKFIFLLEKISYYLKLKGVVKGDRVAILSENSPNWGIVYFAIVSSGIIAVPIMTEFQSDEIKYIIEDSGAKGIFISERFIAKSDELNLSELKFEVNINTLQCLREELTISDISEKVTLSECTEEVSSGDLASIIYTSGTTGHSKGVMLTHKNIVSNALSVIELVNVIESDRLLSILPLAHTMECTLGLVIPVIKGASVYYLDKPPTAAALLPALEIVKPTIMLSVPLVIEKIFR